MDVRDLPRLPGTSHDRANVSRARGHGREPFPAGKSELDFLDHAG
ncbi:MAG: hypothetical protein PWP41_1006 [Moorella sp. (in: firmicutes)]|nr:hypothetical protein [Moorella sp. (in: firmicutes)]